MRDSECVVFLQWALPQMRLRWAGFRKVRRQVCRRIQRRIVELGVGDVAAYRTYLEANSAEWRALEGLCHVTISRFYRDKAVFDLIGSQVLPELAVNALSAGRTAVHVWSAGCGSGEEAYTVSLLWEFAVKPGCTGCDVTILGTDADLHVLRRAARAQYWASALRDIPDQWRTAFETKPAGLVLAPRYREVVRLAAHDVKSAPPRGPFDMVLCRNLAFTYFDDALQHEVATGLAQVLRPGGYLVIGLREQLPQHVEGFERVDRTGCVLRSHRLPQPQ